jgi:hypothetical protein
MSVVDVRPTVEEAPDDDPYLWLEERERRAGETAGPMAADVV